MLKHLKISCEQLKNTCKYKMIKHYTSKDGEAQNEM